MSYIFNDAQQVRSQILGLIAVYPELQEDAELMADMIDGETDFLRIMEKLVEYVRDAETLAEAIKARKADMADRQKRYEAKGDAGRKAILSLMSAADQVKVTLPEATISLIKPRDAVNVIDAEQLPQGFYRTERKPLSKELLAALKSGETIPGAELVTGDPSVSVRTK